MLFTSSSTSVVAQTTTEESLYAPSDTMPTATTDTCHQVKTKRHRSILKSIGRGFSTFIRNFSDVDTTYIEPQGYNFQAMIQNTNTYELYRITTPKGNDFTFAPLPSMKLGPYMGWSWIFLGYTFDLKHISNGNKKKEFDLSIYSLQIGVDFFYRKSGTDYKISRMHLDSEHTINTDAMRGIDYDGINVSIKGANLYYIFNHKRFSYPAAFNQSTIQRRSCGSALCGIGYTQHSLSIDWEKLYSLVSSNIGEDIAREYMDSNLKMNKIKYTDVSFSGGYAYNWVFARNWLAAASMSLALGYKHSYSDTEHETFTFKDFSFHNFNIDGVGRFGIVWNNMRWYFGANTIIHTYTYNKKNFSTNNIFGSLNIYAGINFGRKNKNK